MVSTNKRVVESDDDEAGETRNSSRKATPRREEANGEAYGEAHVEGGSSENVKAGTPSPLELYKAGSIVRILMTKFLIYDRCDVRPGPFMNMIIGPNGTGKSTVVCAIALGLGGGPNLIGRSTKISQFVKFGAREGTIDIWLKKSDKGNSIVHIRRVIQLLDGDKVNNIWAIDNRPATHKDVLSLANTYHIQLDNLCQFMPQDRVIEFSRADAVQRLKETELAAGDEKMWSQHQELIQLTNSEKQTKGKFEMATKELEKYLLKVDTLKKDVEAFKEQEERNKNIKWLTFKLPWMAYEHERALFVGLKDKKEALGRQLKADRLEFLPIKKRHEEVKSQLDELEGVLSDRKTLIEKNIVSVLNEKTELQGYDGEVDLFRQGLLNFEKRKKDRVDQVKAKKAEIVELKNNVQTLEEDLRKTDGESAIDEFKAKYNEKFKIVNERQKLERVIDKLKEDGKRLTRDIQVRNERVERLSDKRQQRKIMLESMDRDTFKAFSWLEENRNRFECPVFGPIIMEVDVPDPKYIDLVASFLGFNLMRTFVCQTPGDYNLFNRALSDTMKLRVNVALVRNTKLSSYQPILTQQELADLGFQGHLVDFVTGPEPVISYLCTASKFHLVPVTMGRVRNELIENNYKVVRYSANGVSYSITRYAHDKTQSATSSLNITANTTSRYLRCVGEDDNRGTLTKEIALLRTQVTENQAKMESLYQECEKLKTREASIETESKALEDRKNLYLDRKKQIELHKRRIEEKKRDIVALVKTIKEDSSQKLKRDLNEVLKKRKNLLYQMHKNVIKLTKLIANFPIKQLEMLDSAKEFIAINNEFREKQDALSAKEEEWAMVEEEYKRKRGELRARLDELNKNYPLSEEAQEAFNNLPHLVEEIEEMLAREKSISEMRHNFGSDVISQLAEAEKKVTECELILEESKGSYEKVAKQIEAIRADWYPRVHTMMTDISCKFRTFFAGLGLMGEVKLHEDGLNFDKWGLELLVSFRGGAKLEQLSAMRHSGGEKSVSTITFLMALQDMAKCPFRVVDEINQGMDAVNERNVHKLMVNTATQPSTSQYFIITPKLLQNLEYNERVTILCVYNGTGLPDNVVRLSKFVDDVVTTNAGTAGTRHTSSGHHLKLKSTIKPVLA